MGPRLLAMGSGLVGLAASLYGIAVTNHRTGYILWATLVLINLAVVLYHGLKLKKESGNG